MTKVVASNCMMESDGKLNNSVSHLDITKDVVYCREYQSFACAHLENQKVTTLFGK